MKNFIVKILAWINSVIAQLLGQGFLRLNLNDVMLNQALKIL